ncbi:malonyl-CoA decarboxylase [Synchytrium endobioticum]|uniref:Malonyl-CoA decarboxylase n=1 Tax=Synchytrium endobioticum TaxID=286115 RepID=A0A507CMV6_9FUNG|nr:malonyl-CoA decarboxylase [Synchytrium endobioticum]
MIVVVLYSVLTTGKSHCTLLEFGTSHRSRYVYAKKTPVVGLDIKCHTLVKLANILTTLPHVPESAFDIPDMPKPAEEGIKSLLFRAIPAKSHEQGDLLPSLLTQQAINFYQTLSKPLKSTYLRVLARDFGVDKTQALKAAVELTKSVDKTERAIVRAQEELRQALIAPYQKFFHQVNQLPEGMSWLVMLRADVLGLLEDDNDPLLHVLDIALKSLLGSWFGIGFLELERLTWNSPASVLEKVISYEAVHEIKSWVPHMKQRLSQGRLCYGFFHRAIPLLPLAYVQVALVDKMASSIQAILDDSQPSAKPEDLKIAMFYSITSTQRGLQGVDLGNFLIKRVVVEIKKNIPTVETFSTLSPIPGFCKWLRTQLNQEIGSGGATNLLENDEITKLLSGNAGGPLEAALKLNDILSFSDWASDNNLTELLMPVLLRLCSRYLLLEKKRSFCLDPVANFHLRNGASAHRINWMGDTSPKGRESSCGMMVNYNYIVPAIELNNQRYMHHGSVAIVSTVEGIHPSLRWAVRQGGRMFTIINDTAPPKEPHL